MQVIEIKLDIKPAGGLTAAMNDIKLKSHNQSFAESGSYKEIREYTYFDSTTRKYLEQKRKNEVRKQQNEVEKQRRELARCTFKPAIESKAYYHATRKIDSIKQAVIDPAQKGPKLNKTIKIEQRLLDWGNKKEIALRNKRIQKELDVINLTKSLSRGKIGHKLNRSLEEISRTPTNEDSFTRSIKAVPIMSREESSSTKNYKTIQSSRKGK